jgi:hypothetical protein
VPIKIFINPIHAFDLSDIFPRLSYIQPWYENKAWSEYFRMPTIVSHVPLANKIHDASSRLSAEIMFLQKGQYEFE